MILREILPPRRNPNRPAVCKPFSFSGFEKMIQTLRRKIEGAPSHFTLDACRHGGMTELEEAELIQQLRAENFSKVRAASALDGDKRMRLNGQTPMIEGGFVLFPKWADRLDSYLTELLPFPSVDYDDQVNSTVYALAWISENPHYAGNFINRCLVRQAEGGIENELAALVEDVLR